MSNETISRRPNTGPAIYAVVIVVAFLLVWGLVRALQHYATPAPVGAPRAEERAKARKEADEDAKKVMDVYELVDKDRGIVRVPVGEARKAFLAEWSNPAAGRSNLLARLAKASAPVAPKKNEYE